MTNQMNTKVRLVRCPRCRKVLPELAELYVCGGCGIVLQAKNRREHNEDTGSRLDKTHPTQTNELKHVSEDKEASSQNQHATIPSPEESALDKSSEKDLKEFRDCEREQHGGVNHSDELLGSTELTCHENAESSPEASANMAADEDKCPLDQNDGRDQNALEDCNREQPGDIKFSPEVLSSSELTHHENESSSPGTGAHENESSSSPGEVDESKYKLEENHSEDCDEVWPENLNLSKEVPSSIEPTCHEIEEPSQLTGVDREVDDNLKSHFINRSSSTEKLLDTRPRNSIVAVQRSLDQSVLSKNITAPINEQPKQAQNSIRYGFERVSAVDTLENKELVDPSSEFGVPLGEMSKSTTTRSYYAYDGSVSSCNETDDQVPDRQFHLAKRYFKDADFVNAKGFFKRDEFKANNKMNSSSILPGKKHRATKGSKWHRDEFSEPTRHGHPIRRMMRLETDENLSRLPLYSRSSQASQGNGIPSRYGRNEFQFSSSHQLPDKPEYPDPEKMELLRMVYELQDQLDRTQISKGKANGRFPARVAKTEKQNSSYYDHLAPEREIYPHLKYPRHAGRYSQGKSWSQQCEFSRMAFSGEATRCRNQVDRSCLHCCPRERHFSTQLPPHISCNKGHYTAQPSFKSYSPYQAGPSSPHRYRGLQSYDTESNDQWHKDREVKKLYLREKYYSMKRYVRPIAGGGSIIACYRCCELLQLPADFLLFRRRFHRLRCSACSKVLKFSLQNSSHLVPYVPETIAPPPSEADEYTDAIKKRNLASASHASHCRHAEPMSCSDDYGQSLCKSCSTDGDPFFRTPSFHTLGKNSNERKKSSGSSFEPIEEREKMPVLKEFRNKNKNPVGTFYSSRRLSKMSKREKSFSEIEELPSKTGSTLHRLMGYSSPSEVIYQ